MAGRGPAGPDLRGQMARGGGRAEPLLTKRNFYCHLPQESKFLCLTDVRMSRSQKGHNLSLRTGIGIYVGGHTNAIFFIVSV
jgi:hypothetical protein